MAVLGSVNLGLYGEVADFKIFPATVSLKKKKNVCISRCRWVGDVCSEINE